MPVHYKGNHWILIVVDMVKLTFMVFDSMDRTGVKEEFLSCIEFSLNRAFSTKGK